MNLSENLHRSRMHVHVSLTRPPILTPILCFEFTLTRWQGIGKSKKQDQRGPFLLSAIPVHYTRLSPTLGWSGVVGVCRIDLELSDVVGVMADLGGGKRVGDFISMLLKLPKLEPNMLETPCCVR